MPTERDIIDELAELLQPGVREPHVIKPIGFPWVPPAGNLSDDELLNATGRRSPVSKPPLPSWRSPALRRL
jgi:hypothetical protein